VSARRIAALSLSHSLTHCEGGFSFNFWTIFECGLSVVFREARKFGGVRVLTSTFDSTLWGFVGNF